MQDGPDLPYGALTVTMQADGDRLLVAVAGEIDLSTAEAFRQALTAAVDKKPKVLTVDLAAVPFMDSSGISALVHTYRAVAAAGGALAVIRCQPRVRRILDVTGMAVVLAAED